MGDFLVCEFNQEPNFKDATTYSYRPLGFDTSQVPEIAYKQSSEDEEELGNIMSDKIGQYIASGEKVEDVKTIVDEIMNKYNASVGLTGMSPEEFKRRWNTPEVIASMTRLFELYNSLLSNYKKAIKKSTT